MPLTARDELSRIKIAERRTGASPFSSAGASAHAGCGVDDRVWPPHIADNLPRCRLRRDELSRIKIAERRTGASPFSSAGASAHRSEEHTSELQSPCNLVCRLL